MSPRPLGFVRRGENPEVRLMIGTAGHVDHGKTCLVRLLTGCETDRLKAEKERGLSIELGFAPCSLGMGIAAGIVDVPGHEHFIKNMVAGAAGMDMAILVVAADDGVMPQTVEHLQIMQFLGVQRGMVVVTKIDLVLAERVEEVRDEVEVLVAGTFLEGAPVCAISSMTGEGFDSFYKALVEIAGKAKSSREGGIFRLPVERTFSLAGHGTVATGIPLAGTISVGDEVEIRPRGARGKVRGMQRFLRDATRGGVGQCLALNLAAVAQDAVGRGDVITKPGYVKACRFMHVVLTTCHDLATPLRNGEEVKLHTGTLEVQGKLRIYTASQLGPRQTGFGAVQFGESIASAPTDRFVLRRNSPSITVAGGVILETLPRKPRGARKIVAEQLAERWASFGTPESRFEHHFRAAGAMGSDLKDAAIESLLEKSEARKMAEELLERERLIRCGGTDRLLHVSGREKAAELVGATVERYLAEHSSSYGPSLRELQAALRLPEECIRTVVDWSVERGALERRENRVGPSGREERLSDEHAELAERIEKVYRDGGFSTPRPDEVAEILAAVTSDVESLLDYLCQKGTLVRLGKKVVFHSDWMREAERIVVSIIREGGSLDSADFKKIIGSSRKYALAILDYFDTIHITERSGNFRRLHPAYVRKHSGGGTPETA